ncbi:TRAP dicarboxylate transporter subunit DctP [Enterococcus sp. 10A9_DIV0425]|uniref:TRAP dicarboxylate transporter subunit DctP n=1 Tax=Candidatus Enterococcus wittei TaxID=1987383 RepID=A0A242K017_9ENTE|nr:TRAP transporter substrate-binding protein [Enterococcus sp. 10A9_DIV0425]OTP11007.1 TRAP dicarboxylate transporter subunit DctP [Enterococcus sp. 10A9_DIV0425]THE16227.1 TRAP transporter substrate-binding protein [Enterococcus hirae]
MKKRAILTSSLCLGFLSLSGCSNATTFTSAEENEVITLRFAYASNSQPVIDAMNEFGRLVEEKTAGSVVLQYFPDGQLGGERELIELTQSGAVDFTKVSASALESFSKDYSIFSVPYLFKDEAHFFNVMDNEAIMEPIYQSTANLGFTGMTYYDSGQRSFYMVDGPVHSPEDLKGKKIRVMQSETAIKMVELLGGSAVPMGSDEVYTSLQANLINGSENNEFVLHTAGHGGVAKYYSYDEHTRVPDIIIMNDASKEQLSTEQELAIEEAAKESTVFEIKAFSKAIEEEKAIAKEKYGVQFNEVDNSPFRVAVAPLHDTFKNAPTYQKLYQMIQEQGGSGDENSFE